MKNDLIERYIYAVTRRLPRKNREDVSRELRSLIDDMLTERCGSVNPGEKDIRIVLTELGSPRELYEKYDENSKKCLIGQPYYSMYLFVLKIVLICSAAGLTIAAGIIQMMEPQVWYEAVGNWLAMLWNGVMGAFAFTTLLYAFFYHRGVQLDEPFNFDDLPPVPKKNQEITQWSCIANIALSVLFLTLFLGTPQVFCVIYKGGELVPLFDTEAMRASWLWILLFTLAGIVREMIKLRERHYNEKVMTVVIGTDVLSAVVSVCWLTGRDLFNPVFKEKMIELFTNEAAFMVTFFENFQYFFLIVILFALMLDVLEAVMKVLRK